MLKYVILLLSFSLVLSAAPSFNWTRIAASSQQVPPPRAAATLIGIVPGGCKRSDQFILLGGYSYPYSILQDQWLFDRTRKFWSTLETSGARPTGRAYASFTREPHFVKNQQGIIEEIVFYMHGGFTSLNPRVCTSELWSFRYKISDNSYTWKLISSAGPAIAQGGEIVLFNETALYMFGGFECKVNHPSAHLFKYDLVKDEWVHTHKAHQWPESRYLHTFTPFNEGKQALVLGGRSKGSPSLPLAPWVFNAQTETFQKVDTIPQGVRYSHVAFAPDYNSNTMLAGLGMIASYNLQGFQIKNAQIEDEFSVKYPGEASDDVSYTRMFGYVQNYALFGGAKIVNETIKMQNDFWMIEPTISSSSTRNHCKNQQF